MYVKSHHQKIEHMMNLWINLKKSNYSKNQETPIAYISVQSKYNMVGLKLNKNNIQISVILNDILIFLAIYN